MAKQARARKAPRLMRNSERSSYKKCQFAWDLNFGISVRPGEPLKPVEEAKALRFGDLVHQALAGHYKPGKKRGRKPWLIFEKIYRHQIEELQMERLNMKDEEKWLDAAELGPAILKGFYEKYHDKDEQYEVMSTEQTFQVPIFVPYPIGHPRFSGKFRVAVVGTLDGLWREMSGPRAERNYFFKEWKTSSSIDTMMSNLMFDEQAGTYWTYAPQWFWHHGILSKGVYPTHILYTFLAKSMPDERPENEFGQKLNQDGTVSKKQPSKRFDRQPIYRDEGDRISMHERIIAEAQDMEMIRAGLKIPIKNPGPLYMPNCRGCPFRDPCELHEQGQDYDSMIDAAFVKWDPYEAHEMIERW